MALRGVKRQLDVNIPVPITCQLVLKNILTMETYAFTTVIVAVGFSNAIGYGLRKWWKFIEIGDFHITSHVKEISSSTTTYCEDKDKHCACQAAVDAAVGLQWITCLCENKYLEFKLGLEHHRIFDYNQFGGYGDLCLDGATFSAAFLF